MSNSSTSNSETRTRRLFWRDALTLVVLLLALEGLTRVPPIATYLSERLDTYENLLWHDLNMLRIREDIAQTSYDGWLIGSSYLQSAVDPHQVEDVIEASTGQEQVVQNMGIALLTDLGAMVDPYEQLYLPTAQPDYIALYTAVPNFSETVYAGYRTGVYESIFWYPDSLTDRITGALYTNSNLYRYLILARNAARVPIERTIVEPEPQGSFIASPPTLNCRANMGVYAFTFNSETMQAGIARLDAFVSIFEAQDIPIMLINLPKPDCTIRSQFADFADYDANYLNPLEAYADEKGLPFLALDYQFQETVPLEEQGNYFRDFTHSNSRGADLFSQWSGDAIIEWRFSD